MTFEQIILQKKATALNAIRKIYHPLTKICYCGDEDSGSWAEQRADMVKDIIDELEKELKILKIKNKTKGLLKK